MFGWCGTVLRVDLTRQTFEKKTLNPDVARDFLGGRGLNAKMLFDEVGPGVDPLGPENLLCFAPGILSATALGLSSRLHVSTLSPYSGILGDGNVGGDMAGVMKQAGYDQISVAGASPKPVYLLIEDGRISFHNAGDLWGLTTWATTDTLVRRHGKGVCVACIGQAGENLVRQACTIVDKYASAARGSGAVWGSKKLKAIVVRGTGRPELFDHAGYITLTKEDKRFLTKDRVQQGVSSVYGSHYGVTHWSPGFRNSAKVLPSEEIPPALHPEAWKAYEIGRAGYLDDELKDVIEAQWQLRKKTAKILTYVFLNQNNTDRIKRFDKAWKKACKDAKIDIRLFHDFRRTAVRNMVRSGVPERVAMMISGHKTRSVFDRYHIVSDEDLKLAAQKQADYLASRMGTISGTIHEFGQKSTDGDIV